jgi:beta-lactamase superfamily II metal-dependent hydrolase
MQIQIFNVARGFCAYVIADTTNTMLIDCGHNETTGFLPANHLAAGNCTGIERFFVLNYDEDHLSGLPRLRELSSRIPISILNRNPSLSADQLRTLKAAGGPLGPGIRSLLAMITTYTGEVSAPPDFGQLSYSLYWNHYPDFTDTNNLSLVLFLHYPGLSIVFPGDLEKAGWLKLLRNEAFRNELAKVNIFVASHHGRESGYALEVFEYCRPSVVVISDEEMKYETQEHSYDQHAKGITWNQTDRRKVLTTRKDGMLTITNRTGGFYIQASG